MLLERFKPSQERTMYKALLALRQERSIRDYQPRFETMATPLTGVSKELLEGSFVNGLRCDIQAELRMLQPARLSRMMTLVQRVEEKNIRLKQVKPTWSPRNPPYTTTCPQLETKP